MRLRVTVGLLCLALGACARKADMIISGGMVWTGLSTGAPHAGAVAVAAGRILAIGDSAQVWRYVGSNTQRIQANGGLVLPGFTDGHTHFIGAAFPPAPVDLHDAATPQEFIRRVKDYAKTLKPREGTSDGCWDQTLCSGQPPPRHER